MTDEDDAIKSLRSALELAGDEPAAVRAQMLAELGQLLTWRLEALLDADATPEEQLREHLDDAIGCLRAAFDSAVEGTLLEGFADIEFDAVLTLLDLLQLRFDVLGEPDDLSAAIEYGHRTLGVLTADDERRPDVLYRQGLSHCARHDLQTGTAQEDRGKALGYLREMRGLIGEDDPRRPDLATRLGCILGYCVLADLPAALSGADCAEALDELARARDELAPDTDPDLAFQVRYRLGMVHALRYVHNGADDREAEVAVTELSALLDHPDTTPAQADAVHFVLATVEFWRILPAGSRAVPTLTGDWLRSLRGTPGDQHRTLSVVRHHLDALSEATVAEPQVSLMLRAVRLMTTSRGDAEDVPDTTVDEALSWFQDAIPELDELEARNELAAIHTALRAAIARQRGDHTETASATDLVIQSAAALNEDHPLRTVIHDVLGIMAKTLDMTSPSAQESSAVITRMERILAELPADHHDRAYVLNQASQSLFQGMAVNRSAVPFERVRDMLTKTIEHEKISGVEFSVAHFVLGLTDGIQGWLEYEVDRLNAGIDRLRETIELVPKGHVLRGLIGPCLGILLYARALLSGEVRDFDAAEFYSADVVQALSASEPLVARLPPSIGAVSDMVAATAKLARNRHSVDIETLDELADKIYAATAQLPAEHALHQSASSYLSVIRLAQKIYGLATASDFTPRPLDHEKLKSEVEAAIAAASTAQEGHFDYAVDIMTLAIVLLGHGFYTRDLASLEQAISMAGKVCASPHISPQERLSALGGLGFGLWTKYLTFRRPRDLSNAIERLEQAELLINANPADGATTAPILHMLGTCYHERADPHRRDRPRAVRAGLWALRERADDVLLQTNSERALNTAIGAVGEAADVARWCLAAGRDESSVAALELGRAIVLHVATIEAGIPALLRDDGYSDLAAEWETESDRTSRTAPPPWDRDRDQMAQDERMRAALDLVANPGRASLPSDLRRRVLEAIEGSDTYARLLDPPSLAEISAALAATASSALVYLLPPEELQPALAVIVHADGTVQSPALPGLRCERGTTFDAFRQAQRALQAADVDSDEWTALQRRWESRLDDVCDWAWRGAMAEVLATIANPVTGRPARLVLVPVGDLGTVPWHAARRVVPGGELRHACEDAVITYTSSARQFVDVSRRRSPPWTSAPAVVRVSSGLAFAPVEAEEIHRRFYPEGTFLGAKGTGSRSTPARVRGLLPSEHSTGASLLHLCCHAFMANPSIDSFLTLAGGSALPVRDILEQARKRPVDADGGLVILAACASDLTGGAHDEALTLATAFLAAGSVGVVGTKWAVADAPTALFMVMFHHYLNSGYDDPAMALRATQRWMLNPRHALPQGITGRLARAMSRYDLSTTANWAAFTYQGR